MSKKTEKSESLAVTLCRLATFWAPVIREKTVAAVIFIIVFLCSQLLSGLTAGIGLRDCFAQSDTQEQQSGQNQETEASRLQNVARSFEQQVVQEKLNNRLNALIRFYEETKSSVAQLPREIGQLQKELAAERLRSVRIADKLARVLALSEALKKKSVEENASLRATIEKKDSLARTLKADIDELNHQKNSQQKKISWSKDKVTQGLIIVCILLVVIVCFLAGYILKVALTFKKAKKELSEMQFLTEESKRVSEAARKDKRSALAALEEVTKEAILEKEKLNAHCISLKTEVEQSHQQADEAKADQERLLTKMQQNQQEIARARQQAEEAKAEQKQLLAKIQQVQEVAGQSEKLNNNIRAAQKEIQARDIQIQTLNEQIVRLKDEYGNFTERAQELEKLEPDFIGLQKALSEQKKTVYQMKRRIEETGMKMQLLDEKTKQNVEFIARFAQGKEFEEFRKSIHLDEIVQRYEDQIKDLKLEKMELEKKAKE